MADTQSTTKFRADISQLKKEMQAASRAVRLASSEFKAATAGMDDWSSSADGLQAKLKQLNTTLDGQRKILELQKKELAATVAEYGENSAAADRVRIAINNQEAQIAKTEAQLKKYGDALGDTADDTLDLDNALEETVDSSARASEGFTVMKGILSNLAADAIKKVVSGLKDIAKETFKVGADYESEMSKVEAISGATSKEMDRLSEKAKEMGSSTIFTAQQSAEAFEYMAMAGWKTSDMLNGVEGIMNLAAASGSDLASASDIVTDALTAMGYSAKDSGRLADVMAAASSNANTNVELMGATFKYVAPIVGALGYSMEDAAVAIGLMANAGIKGEKSGTALRSILTRLSAPPKECATEMERLGLSLTDADGNMKDMSEVIGDLRKAFRGLDKAEQTSAAKHIAGQEAMSGLLAIVNAAPDDFDKLTSAVENSTGAAAEMAATMNDNVNGQLTLLQSNIQGKMIDVFEKASPEIKRSIREISRTIDTLDTKEIAEDVGKVVKGVADLFAYVADNSEAVKSGAKGVGAALGTIFVTNKAANFVSTAKTIAPVITKLGTEVGILKTTTDAAGAAQVALNAAWFASPATWVVAGVVALGAAMVTMRKRSEEAMQAEYGLSEAELEAIDTASLLKHEYNNLKDARDEAISSTSAEFGYMRELKDEYNGLIDANGDVKEGYEDRADFILNQLAEAMGVERSEIEETIDKNGKLGESIDNLILKKQAEATLDATKDAYTEAIQKRQEALNNYVENQKTYTDAENAYKQSLEESGDVLGRYQQMLETAPSTASDYYWANQEVIKSQQVMKEAMESAEQGLRDSETAYVGYSSTIQNWEALSQASATGAEDAISTALTNIQNNLITAETGTRDTLETQLRNFENNYANMQAAVESGMPNVTQAQVDEAGKLVEAARAELDKLDSQAAESGQTAGADYAEGVGSAEGSAAEEGEKVASAAASGAKRADGDNKKAGETTGKKYAEGVSGQSKKAQSAGTTIGQASAKGANAAGGQMNAAGQYTGLQFAGGVNAKSGSANAAGSNIASSAKRGTESVSTYSSGENFGQGFINGIGAMVQSAWQKAYNLARQAWAGLRKGQEEGSPSKLTAQSGRYFTQGFINGIVSLEGKLVKTVVSMAKTAVNALSTASRYNIEEVGSMASQEFADAIANDSEYMISKIQYKNQRKIAEFDSAIAKLKAQSKQKASQIQAASDKKVAKLQEKRDKTSDKNQKNRLKKQIDAEKASAKKLIKANEAKYQKLIKTQEKYKTAYQTASSSMISEFQKAMQRYEESARNLVDNAITGITDRYTAAYDDLTAKQEELTNKLLEVGNTFDVRGAGVMTINDLQKQTQQIRDYSDRLARIREKVSKDLFNEITTFNVKEGAAYIDRLLSMSAEDLAAYNDAYTEKLEAAREASDSIYQADFEDLGRTYQSEIEEALAGINDQMKDLGEQAMRGFVDGLTKNTDYMDANVKTFVNAMVKTFKDKLQIHSPSRLTFGLGALTGEGFDDGLLSMVRRIQNTVKQITGDIASPISGLGADLPGIRQSVNGYPVAAGARTSNVVNNYNLVQNNTSPKALSALETYQARRQQIAMVRAFA